MMKGALAVVVILVLYAAGGSVRAAESAETRAWPIEAMKGVHPRLHATVTRFEELRKLVKEDGAYVAFFAEVRGKADAAVKDRAPKYVEDDGWSGTEQLWQRSVGETIPELAMAYRMTGEKQYLDAARDWMLASLAYKTWGLPPFEGNDLAAGHQLYGIAVAYDWLYGELDEATRKAIREGLTKRAEFMYKVTDERKVYWADSYLQNHLWVNITGLAACGFALYGEVDEAAKWITLPDVKYRRTFELLPADGSSFEGVPYWGYGVEYMLKYMDMARPLVGRDYFAGSEFWKNTSHFRIYSSLPRNMWTRRSNLMSFGDSPRFDWYGPDYLLRKLAAEYRDGHAQWFADEVDRAKINAYVAAFLNVLWYDPSVEPEPIGKLPTFKQFDDLGLVFMRSDWSGDETMCAFKAGPHVGKHALAKLDEDPGSGHVHPDAGAFQIVSHGEWLIVDDGYTQKWTEFQNTLVVNGAGQQGEGYDWFRGDVLCKEKRSSEILAAGTDGEVDYVVGDVTRAYRKEAGLKRFVRDFYYLRPSTWIVVDEVETADPSKYEFYYHGEYPFEKAGEGRWVMKGQKADMDFLAVAGGAAAEATRQQLKGIGGEEVPKPLDTLKLTLEGTTKARFVNVLSARPAGAKSTTQARIKKAGDGELVLVVVIDGREIELTCGSPMGGFRWSREQATE